MSKHNKTLKETDIYKDVLQNMQDGVIAVDTNGIIVVFNPAVASILMIKDQNIVGRHFSVVFSKLFLDPRNDELNDIIMSAIYQSRMTHHGEVGYYFENTSKTLLISSMAFFSNKKQDTEKKGIILVMSDVTEKQRLTHIKTIFSKYIDPKIANKLMDSSEEELRKANKQIITVGFCDMNDFTSISESLSPMILEDLMNVFFSEMSASVHRNQGVIDKFIGDTIMSFWGVPFTDEDKQVIHACQTALDQIASLEKVNKKVEKILKSTHEKINININIGIATGELAIASVGNDEHRSFTIMGNVVNFSSRLVGVNKVYGTHILLSEQVKKSLGSEFECREIDTIRVKGKKEKTKIYELLGKKETISPQKIKFIKQYESALNHYRQRHWEEAKLQFEEALMIMPDDKATRVFLERIKILRNQELDDSWEAVWTLETK